MIARLFFTFTIFLSALFAPISAAHSEDDVTAAARSVVRIAVLDSSSGAGRVTGYGSGIVTGKKRVITALSIVAAADKAADDHRILVILPDRPGAVIAKIVARKPELDLAVLEANVAEAAPATFYVGSVPSGTAVTALGYPGDPDPAISKGDLAAIGARKPVRSEGKTSNQEKVNGYPGLTHSATLVRPATGGALVDACGRVLGVNLYLTRADSEEAAVPFALGGAEAGGLLAEVSASPALIADPCLTGDAYQQGIEKQEADAAAKKAAADARATEMAALERAKILEAQNDRLVVTGLFALLAVAALGAAALLFSRSKQTLAYLAGGAVLIFGGAAAFSHLTRPTLETVGKQAEEQANPAFGKLMCVIDKAQSRVTVSKAADLPMSITPEGCVNGRTQYSDAGGGIWQRIFVPKQEAHVQLFAYDPANKRLTVTRYLLEPARMAAARKLRDDVKVQQCTSDVEAVTKLGIAQETVRSALPKEENERLVYRCSVAK